MRRFFKAFFEALKDHDAMNNFIIKSVEDKYGYYSSSTVEKVYATVVILKCKNCNSIKEYYKLN